MTKHTKLEKVSEKEKRNYLKNKGKTPLQKISDGLKKQRAEAMVKAHNRHANKE